MKRNIQERINTYAKFAFGEEVTDNMDEIYGKVQDVILLLKENKKYCNSPEVEFDEEELKDINQSLDSLIEELNSKYEKEDFVRLIEHPMDSQLHIQDIDELLKDLQFYYLTKVEEEIELKDINIDEFVMCYFDKEHIENLVDYAATKNQSISQVLTNIYEEILDIINIEYDDLSTTQNSDSHYTSTINFNNKDSIQIETKDVNSYSDIVPNITTITNKYLELQNEYTNEQENELEME